MMKKKNDMYTNGWSIENGDYNRSFKDEKRIIKKERRKKIVRRTTWIIIYFAIIIGITYVLVM